MYKFHIRHLVLSYWLAGLRLTPWWFTGEA